MKEIILMRNKLRDNAMRLRTIKFDESVKEQNVSRMNEEQNKLWNKYKFYDNFIKTRNKEVIK